MPLHMSIKPGTAIEIGDDVIVCISKNKRSGFRVSIDAPKEKNISRRKQTVNESRKMRRKNRRKPLTSKGNS